MWWMKRGNIIGMLECHTGQDYALKGSGRQPALGVDGPALCVPCRVPVCPLFAFLHSSFTGGAQNTWAVFMNGEYIAAEVADLLVTTPWRVIGICAIQACGFRAYKDLDGVGDIIIGVHLGTTMGAKCCGYCYVCHVLPPALISLSAGDGNILMSENGVKKCICLRGKVCEGRVGGHVSCKF